MKVLYYKCITKGKMFHKRVDNKVDLRGLFSLQSQILYTRIFKTLLSQENLQNNCQKDKSVKQKIGVSNNIRISK